MEKNELLYGLNAIGTILISSVLNSSCACLENNPVKPNVLLILTDDQGWGDFGFNGNSDIHTPVLDSLSEISAHFSNFYVSPLSATTRAGLLTGRDHLRTGSLFVTRAAENMDANERTIAEVLKQEGYSTGCFGKWHNGTHYPQDPNGQGFENFVGFCSGHHTNYFDTTLQFNQELKPVKGYITNVLTDYGIDYIKTCVQNQKGGQEKPFFCYMAYNAPHAPYQVEDVYYDKYRHLQKDSLDTAPAVYAMCECIDYNIGRLLQTLKDQNVLDNTIVIFMTDNGPNNIRFNGHMRGKKGDVYEGGIKVPCLMYWKDKFISTKISETVSYIDVMPTILDLCNIHNQEDDVSHKMDGLSVKPLLLKDNSNNVKLKEHLESRFLFTHRSNSDTELFMNNGLIFNDRYKLLVLKDQRLLFDKLLDPMETHDLSKEKHEVFQSFSKKYDKWFVDIKEEFKKNNKRSTSIGVLNSAVILPAHEAFIKGNVHYYTNIHGWAGDWLTNIFTGDTIAWQVDVKETGRYAVELQYALPKEIKSLKVAISSSLDKTESASVVLPVFKSKHIESPDRVKRVEAYEQTWNSLALGEINLSAKNELLMLKIESENRSLKELEIKGISIKKIK